MPTIKGLTTDLDLLQEYYNADTAEKITTAGIDTRNFLADAAGGNCYPWWILLSELHHW